MRIVKALSGLFGVLAVLAVACFVTAAWSSGPNQSRWTVTGVVFVIAAAVAIAGAWIAWVDEAMS